MQRALARMRQPMVMTNDLLAVSSWRKRSVALPTARPSICVLCLRPVGAWAVLVWALASGLGATAHMQCVEGQWHTCNPSTQSNTSSATLAIRRVPVRQILPLKRGWNAAGSQVGGHSVRREWAW